MANPDDFLYEYAVVRYVPRVDREEFVNIGLLMLCKRRKWLKGKIELNEKRLKAFDPSIRLDTLERQASVFMMNDVPQRDIPVEEKYRWLTAVKSAVLQVSPSHPGLICSCEAESTKEAQDILSLEFARLFAEIVAI